VAPAAGNLEFDRPDSFPVGGSVGSDANGHNTVASL
jgi:hypothetical protein